MHDLASLAVPCLAWTRLRPNKVRARRGAGPGGPRRPARGSSGAHRFDGAAVTWRSMGWRRRVVGARACHRRCRVIRPKFTDTGTSSALMHARGRGRLGRSPPPPPFRGARPCPRTARGCPPAPARLERVRHHIGGSWRRRRRRRGGGLFTIHIAEEDRPRRWRAHRHCTNGRAVSPITCWVALAPKGEWAGGRRLILRHGHYSTRGSARSVHWSPGSAKTSLPCTHRTRQVLHRA